MADKISTILSCSSRVGSGISKLGKSSTDMRLTVLPFTVLFAMKAIKDAGYPNVPVISFNVAGLEKNSGFKITPKLLVKLFKGIIYGDMLQTVFHKNKAYEVNEGESKKLLEKWIEKCNFVGACRIIGQVEMMSDKNKFIEEIKAKGLESGLSFDVETEIKALIL